MVQSEDWVRQINHVVFRPKAIIYQTFIHLGPHHYTRKKTIITGSWPLILYQVYQLHDPVVPDHATNGYQA